jgi:hypothetical protein
MIWCIMIYDVTWYMWYDMIYNMIYDIYMIYDMIYIWYVIWYMIRYDMIYDIYLLTAIGLPPGGSSTVHIYTQTMCPFFAGCTLAFAL